MSEYLRTWEMLPFTTFSTSSMDWVVRGAGSNRVLDSSRISVMVFLIY